MKTLIIFLLILSLSGGINPKWIFPKEGNGTGVNGLDMPLDSKYIVAGIRDTLYVLNTSTGNPIWMLKINTNISSLDLSEDGRYLAIFTSTHSILFIDIYRRSILWNYSLNEPPISMRISENGDMLSVITYRKLYLFKNFSGNSSYTYKISEYEFDKNPRFLSMNNEKIIVSLDDEIYMFNKTLDKPIRTLKTNSKINGIDISKNYISIILSNKSLLLMNIDMDILWNKVLGDIPRFISITRNEKRLIIATNQFIYIFDIKNSSMIYRSTFLRSRPKCLSVSYNGDIFAVGGYAYIYFFSIKSRIPIYAYSLCTCVFPYIFNEIVVSRNGQYVAAGTNGEKLYLFQLKFKKTSWITLYYNFTDIGVGDTITIKGILKPGLKGKYIGGILFTNGESHMVGIAKTDENGEFIFKIKVLYKDFILRFIWEGDDEYFGCISDDIHIRAREYASLTINISKNNVAPNEMVNIYGELSSKRGKPIGNSTIYIRIILPNNSTKNFKVSTDSSGGFSLKYTPVEEGRYNVIAIWNGSKDYKPTKSSIETFIVKAKAIDYTAIIIIIAAIIIAIIFLLIFFRKKFYPNK